MIQNVHALSKTTTDQLVRMMRHQLEGNLITQTLDIIQTDIFDRILTDT